jgi:formylglycine-generating enzyme required for sulfatase activity
VWLAVAVSVVVAIAVILLYVQSEKLPAQTPLDVAPVPAPAAHLPVPLRPEVPQPAATPSPTVAAPIALAFDNGTRDCDQICPRMVLIPKGTFAMGIPESESSREGTVRLDGDARPVHPVTIGRPFYMSEAPVTRREYNECVTATKCPKVPAPSFRQTENDPVVNVSYDDAKTYASWLRQKTGKDYRLPSEAEWEYAARAGARTARYWGDDFDDGGEHTVPRDRYGTMPVRSFPPNNFGLFDMLGHVWQWTEDCWNVDYSGGFPADETPMTIAGCGGPRVLRGGSWYDDHWASRAGSRVGYGTADRVTNAGFRVARTY